MMKLHFLITSLASVGSHGRLTWKIRGFKQEYILSTLVAQRNVHTQSMHFVHVLR